MFFIIKKKEFFYVIRRGHSEFSHKYLPQLFVCRRKEAFTRKIFFMHYTNICFLRNVIIPLTCKNSQICWQKEEGIFFLLRIEYKYEVCNRNRGKWIKMGDLGIICKKKLKKSFTRSMHFFLREKIALKTKQSSKYRDSYLETM